ncbi:MAG: hypothetical protein A3H96_19200 [Acidobacteria bacterium RIFCSPLOWO2_02_FULL_67_36]|nr:MAG: hypothetical protein A3H96_19200 [Acidobacteria bacterium RIFCSPLOWO2_02_FULL_67_36]OFW25248.1 MAG: hypothetical protein A3G21_19725 [Acidobacteria bacterium RIFCSPLOWO2_12_FULL_66_21]
MKKVLACFGMALLISSTAFADEWTGKISDSMCGVKHGSGEHDGKKMTDRDCTEACIKGGAKYVFVSGDKVYKISNQDFAGLKTHAGHEVVLSGDMKDDAITVSKIEMPKETKK